MTRKTKKTIDLETDRRDEISGIFLGVRSPLFDGSGLAIEQSSRQESGRWLCEK